ncbi:MAG: dihydroorotate dehydrogenase electron transfer subunit [Oscillospiraceae bacterium]|nr:dihydroorotate dehydrogenase electron transfer subunit [Oscillospiraceae bacterium]
MKQGLFKILENKELAPDVHQLVLEGDTSAIRCAGQFIDIRLDGHFLRRPFSICDWTSSTLTVVYRTVGKGTAELSEYQTGKTVELLTGLGNGFDTTVSGDKPLLVAGGSGVPMMYALAKELIAEGKQVSAVLGYRTAADVFLANDIEALGVNVTITTEDGTLGIKGFVTDAMQDMDYTYFYTCGPEAMFKAVHRIAATSGQFSFEARMGCGYGACMGCTMETKNGYKRICKDGPVLVREELIW